MNPRATEFDNGIGQKRPNFLKKVNLTSGSLATWLNDSRGGGDVHRGCLATPELDTAAASCLGSMSTHAGYRPITALVHLV